MTDIHSHFVFGVDDGAESLDDSLRMLEQAGKAGISRLIATPHVTEAMTGEGGIRIRQNFQTVYEALEKENIPVHIHLASELYYNEFIYRWKDEVWFTLDHNGKYLLFELPLFDFPAQVSDFIFQCKLQGIHPILAHPERYGYLRERPDQLWNWRELGCLMQLNAGSLLGQFGKKIKKVSERLLRMGFYHFVASDAHDTKNRHYYVMKDACDRIGDLTEETYAVLLSETNPLAALQGDSIRTYQATAEDIESGGWQKWLDKLKNWSMKKAV